MTNKTPSTQNLVKAVISPQIFTSYLTQGEVFKVIEGLPQGAIFKGMYINTDKTQMVLVYEHESFPETEVGDKIPEFQIVFYRYVEGEAVNTEV